MDGRVGEGFAWVIKAKEKEGGGGEEKQIKKGDEKRE